MYSSDCKFASSQTSCNDSEGSRIGLAESLPQEPGEYSPSGLQLRASLKSQNTHLLGSSRHLQSLWKGWGAHNESESRSVVSNSCTVPWTVQSMEFSRPEYWSGLPFPSPGDLPNPGMEPKSLSLQADQLSHKGSPRILEWIAYPFSRGSSRPRNRTGVSCIAGGFFTNRASREALKLPIDTHFPCPRPIPPTGI